MLSIGGATNNSLQLEWTSDEIADQYQWQVFNDAGGTSQRGSTVVISGGTPGTPEPYNMTALSLSPNTQYWFRVSPMVNGVVQQVCALQAFSTTT